MDSFIYALVLVPALRDLLPKSGVPTGAGEIGFYGGLLFAIFLIGWGCAFLWGPIADRFGRVRTLMLTILCYSLFTFLGAVAANVWQLALFRFFAGAGIGGEWTLGGVFVAEEWPESRRREGAAYMHTGYYFGTFLAAIVNYTVGAHYGWRAVFAVGGAPALLLAFIRYGVVEPDRWKQRMGELGRWTARRAFLALFSPEYRRRTVVNSTLLLVSMIGLWAGSVYVPSSVTYLASNAGYSNAHGAQLASYGTMLLSIGTILGCLMLPSLAAKFGRRGALGFYFVLMLLFIALGFGYVFYLGANALVWFFVCLFFLGVGGANFAVYTLWLPEQYRTECRGSAFAFATSFGRFLAAGVTFLVGAGVAHYQTIGKPVAITALAFLAGLFLLPLAEETRDKELPA
ncbi:MAG TPA: MFS transporter [Bryobacteraceae bacterium]|nr:MFS transporter [Bryobacteraceae bacterium]